MGMGRNVLKLAAVMLLLVVILRPHAAWAAGYPAGQPGPAILSEASRPAEAVIMAGAGEIGENRNMGIGIVPSQVLLASTQPGKSGDAAVKLIGILLVASLVADLLWFGLRVYRNIRESA